MTTARVGTPDERRRGGEVVHHEERDPPVDILEDATAVFITVDFPAEVEVTIEPTRVVFRGPGAPRGMIIVDLPAPVDPEGASCEVRNGVVDIVAPKLSARPSP